MNPKPDQEGLIDLLGSGQDVLEDMPPASFGEEGNGNGNGKKVLGQLIEVKPEEEWAEDSFGNAWNKIRNAFLRSKTAFDIKAYAKTLSEAAWLDIAMKMAPKDVKVTGEISMKHMLEELGPINKDQYRLEAKQSEGAVDVEFCEVV